MRIDLSQVSRFWKLFDGLITIDEYYSNGSVELKYYIENFCDTPKSYLQEVNKLRPFYSSINRNNLEFSPKELNVIKEFFSSIGFDTDHIEVHLIYGILNCGGDIVDDKAIICLDMFSKNPDTKLKGLSKWQFNNIEYRGYLSSVITHEIVHILQDNLKDKSLLSMALREGIADYVAYRATTKKNKVLHDYGDNNYNFILSKFQNNLESVDIYNWMYNASSEIFESSDVGYYIGFKVAEFYYNRNNDKNYALRQMIQMRDAKHFLSESKIMGGSRKALIE